MCSPESEVNEQSIMCPVQDPFSKPCIQKYIVLLLESSSSQSRYYSSVICLHQMLDYCQNVFSAN